MSNFEETMQYVALIPATRLRQGGIKISFFLKMPFRACRNYQECLANTLYAAKQTGLSSPELSQFGSVISREELFFKDL